MAAGAKDMRLARQLNRSEGVIGNVKLGAARLAEAFGWAHSGDTSAISANIIVRRATASA
jgi:hypothetical protein